MLDPVSLGISAGMAGLNALSASAGRKRAQQDSVANTMLQMALQRWQKEQGERGLRMAGAERTDAFGNSTRYDPALNKWITQLTDEQGKIASASEQEQKRQLTIDALRNRRQRERSDRYAQEAGAEYDQVNSAYKNKQPADELATRGELQTLYQRISEDRGRKKIGNIGQSMIRQGRGAMLENLLRAADEDTSSDFGENMLKARSGAISETSQRQQQHEGKYRPQLAALAQLREGKPAPVELSNIAERLSAGADKGATNMQAALASLLKGVSGVAFDGAKYSKENDFDLRGMAGIINALSGRLPRVGSAKAGKTSNTSSFGDLLDIDGSANMYGGLGLGTIGDYQF